jgi:hypothetical protein
MKNSGWIVVLLAIAGWTLLPGGSARAQTPYVNCSTGAPPFTPVTVAANSSSSDVVVVCNAGDVALGGGYEVLSPPLPLPTGTLVITPENSFYFSDVTAVGWQVVLQNIANTSSCLSHNPRSPSVCPSVQFRVCVSCVTPPP